MPSRAACGLSIITLNIIKKNTKKINFLNTREAIFGSYKMEMFHGSNNLFIETICTSYNILIQNNISEQSFIKHQKIFRFHQLYPFLLSFHSSVNRLLNCLHVKQFEGKKSNIAKRSLCQVVLKIPNSKVKPCVEIFMMKSIA